MVDGLGGVEWGCGLRRLSLSVVLVGICLLPVGDCAQFDPAVVEALANLTIGLDWPPNTPPPPPTTERVGSAPER
jgi:hypothetical protein